MLNPVQELRKTQPAIGVLLYTAVNNLSLKAAATNVPACEVLFKPLKPRELMAAISRPVWASVATTNEPRPGSFTTLDAAFGQHYPLAVLIVEDNLVNQKVLLRLLQRLGYAADLAANGQEAVAALQARAYDVIFMDIQMPVMDGPEATRLIRCRRCRTPALYHRPDGRCHPGGSGTMSGGRHERFRDQAGHCREHPPGAGTGSCPATSMATVDGQAVSCAASKASAPATPLRSQITPWSKS